MFWTLSFPGGTSMIPNGPSLGSWGCSHNDNDNDKQWQRRRHDDIDYDNDHDDDD